MKGNMLRLFEAVKHSVPLPLLTVENRRSMVFSENVAEAVRCVIDSSESVDQTFFVSDGSDLSTPDLLRAVGIALGKTPALFAMPEGILRAAGRFADLLAPAVPLP